MNEGDAIKELRKSTGAPILDCRKVLKECGGDTEKARVILKEKGFAKAQRLESRSANQGAVASYIHHDGKTGALVEINCETDFVAKNEIFKALAKEVTLQIVACSPLYVARENVPQDGVAKVPENEREDFYKTSCLLEQPSIRDAAVSIGDLIKEAMSKLGENIVVKRFIRYKVGE